MRYWGTITGLALVLAATTSLHALPASAAEIAAAAQHVMLTPDQVKWQPAPALGPGLQLAILSGDSFRAGAQFVFRIKMPDGAKVPPHWHPVEEHVTVISGTFLYGVGDKFDEHRLRELPQGSYAFMPSGTRHFAMAKGEVVTQQDGIGPFKVFYVNPADDPSKTSK